MSEPSRVRYQLDDRDAITFVNDAWEDFALANDGEDAARANVLGRVIWDFIADDTTRGIYRHILRHVRRDLRARFTLRCDAPAQTRLLEMTVDRSAGGAVEFSTRMLDVEHRPPVTLLSRHAARSDGSLALCAWCSRVEVSAEDWAELEPAVRRLGLFDAEALPRLVHATCPACRESMNRKLA